MLKKPNNQEIRTNFELSLREVNLIKKIRSVEGSGEFLLLMEAGEVKKIKYSKLFYHIPANFTEENLLKFIREKVPFGEINVLMRNGKPYGITSTLQYDDLSNGF